MKNYIFTILFTLSIVSAFSQNDSQETDSLWNNWNNQYLTDSVRFESINLLSQKSLFTAPDSAFILASSYLKYATEISNEKERGTALKLQGVSWAIRANFDSSYVYFEKALEAHKKAKFDKGIADLTFNLANIHISWGDTLEALSRYSFSEKFYISTNDTIGMMKTAGIQGSLMSRRGSLDSALIKINRALQLANNQALFKEKASFLIERGRVFEYEADFEGAMANYQQAIELGRKNNSDYILSYSLIELAELLAENNETSEALKICNESLELARKMGVYEFMFSPLALKAKIISASDSAYLVPPILEELTELSKEFGTPDRAIPAKRQLVNYYLKLGRYKKALVAANENEEYLNSLGIDNDYEGIFSDKAIILIKLGRNKEALPYALQAAKISSKNNVILNQKNAQELLSNIYQNLGQYENAFLAQKELLELEKILLSNENERAIVKASISNEFEKQALQDSIQFVFKEEILTSENKIQKRISTIALVGLGILAILSLILFNSRRTIATQKAEISKSLEEKDTLLREIHHRVKNNLQIVSSLLRLQTRSTKDEQAKGALNESQTRVESMSLIHQNLYQKENLTGIKMKDYLEKLTTNLFSTYKVDRDQVKLKLDIEDLNLDVETVVPLGLVINELVTNSLKYAFPEDMIGTIIVSLKEKNEILKLMVKDDGLGMENVEENTSGSSFGYKLIKAFNKKLKAQLNINSSLNNGTKVILQIKNFKEV